MEMGLSTGALVAAAGTTAVVGGVGLAVVFRLSSTSPTWAARLAPITAVVAVAAGVTAASMAMLLDAEQVLLMVLVLAVSTSIAVIFGVIGGRRVADLQRRAAEHEAALQRDREIEERRRELISWLSHDLRTPLARMRALTEAQEDGLAPVDYSTRMMREVDGLTVIVEDIAPCHDFAVPPRNWIAKPQTCLTWFPTPSVQSASGRSAGYPAGGSRAKWHQCAGGPQRT